MPELSHFNLVLLDLTSIPPWMLSYSNPCILTAYRPPNPSIAFLFRSLFYAHNELLNTWSHLLPCLYFLHLSFFWPSYSPPQLSLGDILALRGWALSTAICFYLSTLYHLGSAHSHAVARTLLQLDYAGIALTITATSCSAMHAGLRDKAPHLLPPYLTTCIFCAGCVLLSLRAGEKASAGRVVTFALLMGVGFAPALHMWAVLGTEGIQGWPMKEIGGMCLTFLMAAGFYVTGWPERKWPGRFDLLGSSHQIFHLLILLGLGIYWTGLQKVLLHSS